jgi:DNA topoisomerase-1
VTLREGRFGPFVQLGEGEKPKRTSLLKGMSPASVDLATALKLLALPREVARHPETGEPILANIGRYGPYVQHGKVYANLGRDDDVLEIGGNRAIDLIVAKESGAGGFRRGAADPGRPLGNDPESGAAIVVKGGRFGPYVTDGTTNATLPRSLAQEAVTLEDALPLLAARREAGGSKSAKGRGRKSAKKAAPTKSSAAKSSAKAGAAKAGTKAAPKSAAKKSASKTAAKAGTKTAAKKAGTKAAAKKTPSRKAG